MNCVEMKCSEEMKDKISVVIGGDNNKVIIEEGVEVVDSLKVYIEDNDNVVFIGKGTTFEETSISVADTDNFVCIGQDCMFARGVQLLASDFHAIVELGSGKRRNISKGIVIDNHVWIGYGSLIKKNTHIFSNSIISAGTVVQGVVAANSIFTGNLEKNKKRKEYTWERNRQANICPVELYEVRNRKKIEKVELRDDILVNVENDITKCFNKIEGWIFWKEKDSRNSELYVYCRGKIRGKAKNWVIPIKLKERLDVAEYFQDNKYIQSGFDAYMPAEIIANWSRISSVELIIKNDIEVGKTSIVNKDEIKLE